MSRALLLLLLTSCGPPSYLVEGSLSEVLDLKYRWIKLAASDTEVAVRFVRPRGEGLDTVLQVTSVLTGITLDGPVELPLADRLENGSQRGVLSRNVLDDPRQDFPELERGRLILYAAPPPDGMVLGEFSATFQMGTHYASGRTAFATFNAEVR
jgi:hypothetical protein